MKKACKLCSIILTGAVCLSLTGCTQFNAQLDSDVFHVGMITDTGGVNDRSFNQSAWTGMKQLKEDYGDKVSISYVESKQEADFASNFDRMVDKNNLVWGIGYVMADAMLQASTMNPDGNFAIVDNSFEDTPDNVTGVIFRAEEGAFLVGYIAGLTTKTDQVGFVGGLTSAIIDQFEYGYKAGVDYAAAELNKTIKVDSQYTQSFADAAKGKAIANKMYTGGCDIVFHASGGCGPGVIASAVDNNAYAIGVDSDQAYLAPDHVLTSSLKMVNKAIEEVSVEFMNGENIGGQTKEFGIKEGAVGIPEEHSLMGDEVYNKAMALSDRIAAGELVIPYNLQTYQQFDATAHH